jgi:DNA polymerase-3 subunit epsilon
MTRIAVIDFETTGISPAMGDRATEVAIVMMEGGRVVDRFQSLMNAGVRIPSFITQLTGITNAMVATAPPAAQVMAEAGRFVGDVPMVAHNASFDRKFWVEELARAGLDGAAAVCLHRVAVAPAVPAGSQPPAGRAGGFPPPAAHRAGAPGAGRCGDGRRAAGAHPADLRERYAVPEPTHALLRGAADLAARGRAEAAQRVPLRGMRTGAQSGERAQVRRTTTLPIE